MSYFLLTNIKNNKIILEYFQQLETEKLLHRSKVKSDLPGSRVWCSFPLGLSCEAQDSVKLRNLTDYPALEFIPHYIKLDDKDYGYKER